MVRKNNFLIFLTQKLLTVQGVWVYNKKLFQKQVLTNALWRGIIKVRWDWDSPSQNITTTNI